MKRKHLIHISHLTRAIIGALLLGGALLATGIAGVVSHTEPDGSSWHRDAKPTETRQHDIDVLVEQIEYSVQQDETAQLRRGR